MREPNILHPVLWACLLLRAHGVASAEGLSKAGPSRAGIPGAVLPPSAYQAVAVIAALLVVALLMWNLLLRRRIRNSPTSSRADAEAFGRGFSSEMEEALAAAIHAAELASATVPELCEKCVGRIRKVFRLDALIIYCRDADRDTLDLVAASGLPAPLAGEVDPGSASENTMAFLRQAVHTACADHITDVSDDTRAPELVRAAHAAGLEAVDILPLVSKTTPQGVAVAFAAADRDVQPFRTHGFDVLGHELAHAMRVKDVECRLRLERQRLNDVLRAMGDGVMVIDRQLHVIWCSHADMDAPGHGGTERGEKCHRHRHEQDEPCPECPAVRAFSSGQLEIGEVHVSSSTGEHRWYQVTAAPLRKDGDGVRQVLVVSHDVTEQQLLRHQLIWADKLSSVGELVAGVAHELNNPLAAVLGFSELMLAGDVPRNMREDLERVHKEAVRCRKVVQNLLSFARHAPFEKKPVSINELIDTTLELKSYQLRVDNVTVRTELSRELPVTVADGQQLQQVFINLINNAHDAIREKGTPGTLTVRTSLRDDRIIVEVADTGPGIPAEYLHRVFDPFFTTKEPGEGTGLGLSLTYGIVKEHNGDIHVESTPGTGTVFTVELPVERVSGGPAGDVSTVREGPVGRRQLDVMIVDDEPAMVELISSFLRLEGHRVTTTGDSREALRLIERHVDRFDLIITDVKMPGVSGEQLYSRVCELRPHFARNIIFTTGDTAGTETRKLLELTGNTVLEKPFRIEDLRQVIDRTVAEVL